MPEKYIIGLKTGGLMESPEWQIQDILHIYADSLVDAKNKWAIQTNFVNSPHWNKQNQTYFGWELVEIKS